MAGWLLLNHSLRGGECEKSETSQRGICDFGDSELRRGSQDRHRGMENTARTEILVGYRTKMQEKIKMQLFPNPGRMFLTLQRTKNKKRENVAKAAC